MTDSIDNPILNAPYDPPTRHFAMGQNGPTGEINDGRRPSESFIPIAATRKAQASGVQEMIDFDLTGERRQRNDLINQLRREVDRWRQRDYERATPISRKLLQHWADPNRENRVLFCQREAAETAIFLAEVAGRHGYTDWRRRVDDENAAHNSGLPRLALKMATGAGKTVVMAMLIAWQTLNKVYSPRDARFAKRFLVITPGITIRDRLRVLFPGDPGNYYALRDLIPPDLEGALHQAQIIITNYHAFLLRDAKEIKGVSKTTRQILLAGKSTDPFKETPEAMVTRVLRDFGVGDTTGRQEIVVLNDEAHHCYQDKPIEAVAGHGKITAEQAAANEDARVWFKGIQAINRRIGVKQVYDLSATPFYLSGSGYNEGFIFPWTVSDFSLMDAIESGIVKVPQTPVDDDAAGDLVTYLRLWDHIGDKLPKRKSKDGVDFVNWPPPEVLEGALRSLYRSYERSYAYWHEALEPLGQTPPVYIVVCPNTVVSKLVYDWIAGSEVDFDGNTVLRPGNLELFSNVVDGELVDRPRTILVDSAQLESGEALKGDFKTAAATEIAAFKNQYRLNNPGADVDKITDEDLLREVMNTVGKPGALGAGVRCVVSVAMLTEGWDANTVTHILGIRAFGSQLLCEQVVGRGLRRRSYAVNDDGRFEPEYAQIYGIPFAFIPSDRATKEAPPRPPAQEVASVEGREHLRICFPKLDGYRIEIPDAELIFSTEGMDDFVISRDTVPTWTETAGIVGRSERIEDRDPDTHRTQAVAFYLARRLLTTHYLHDDEDRRPWLFPQLVKICIQWIEQCVRVCDGRSIGYLISSAEKQAEAAEALINTLARQQNNRRGRLRPMLRRFDPTGSTENVYFLTHKPAIPATKSEVSHVVLDGVGTNTWEQILALECELSPRVAAFVKNDHLGFTIPYVHKGRSHAYVPDFLLRLVRADGEGFDRVLIVEVSGGQKSPGPTREKARTARDSWCPAVNNHGGFGRWGYVEVTDMATARDVLNEAIEALYADAPIIGDPDLLDYNEVRCGA
ncbi:BPTD_3080 family restriction endonuclease [[Mycobacterium] vasticus]|uniref:DEAD/DEAH box helicase family protein n=1 Tax=[Mycobacterium] vasticus TaxID=2875777 RepID=A0ABU5YZ01_9MYCO|nr:DEAD/DEAH box helicase family protein [Mycolicibacter sp. MYC017]MEB3070372.1 DEAD/DEAH box helicase family protein [Mycolicibacter sp. MYC017]